MRKAGKYTLVDGKIRVNYATGTESVLFEDVSSLSWITQSTIRWVYAVIAFIPAFLTVPVIEVLGTTFGSIFLGGILIVGLFLLFKDKKKWDNVVIETRGGKIISFSVDAGKGRVVMEKIEEDKRNHFSS